MASSATLNGTTVHIHLEDRDSGYIVVEFIHSAAQTGKRVELVPGGGSAGITAWINGIKKGVKDSTLPGSTPQYTRYRATAGEQDIFVQVLHAQDVTVSPNDYVAFPNPPASIPETLINAPEPDPSTGRKLTAVRWKFIHPAGDQVIITIIMLDNEGGGGASGVFRLHLQGEGQTFVGQAELVEVTD